MKSDRLSLLKQAANPNDRHDLPKPAELVEALLDLEKSAKKEKINYNFAELIGCWNLRFITGTKKSRQKAGIALGAGRYIPQFIKIQITYKQDVDSSNTGRVTNAVKVAMLDLCLNGPVEFISPKNILAFDFTSLRVKIFGLEIYDGYIQNGATKEKDFYNARLAERAFFSYFVIQKKAIAARGKGGGLALWVRDGINEA